jgi:hypothetical protein
MFDQFKRSEFAILLGADGKAVSRVVSEVLKFENNRR